MIEFHRAVALLVLMASPLPGVSNLNVSGSAYVDYLGTNSQLARDSSLSGLTPEFALKIDVDASEHLNFSAKVCMGCHGFAVDRFYGEWTPKPWFNAQAGRIAVPFGDFAMRYDPASYRTVSKPMMYEMGRMLFYRPHQLNLGVVPAPYVETGAMVYGQVWPASTVQLWYGAYVVAGLKGENDIDWASMTQSYFNDNNKAPAGGGRVVLTYSAASADALLKDLSLGVSGMYGFYDSAATRSYLALGGDLTARIWVLKLRGEFAWRRTDINPALRGYRFEVIDPFVDRSGFYVELEHPIGEYLSLAWRFDGLIRAGVPLPNSDLRLTPLSTNLRATVGAQVNIITGLFGKVSYEYWLPGDFGDAHVFHVGLGGAF